jgi:hypothetical protein
MRKLTTAAAVALAILGAAELSVTTVQAAPHARATANSNQPYAHTQVLRFLDKVAPGSNTDIDLGAPGFSAGNQQVFRDPLYQNGHRVGYAAGVGQVVALTSTTLTAQVVTTATLPTGTLTYQFAFTEILADGPPTVVHLAITGGTGTYRDARGQCLSKFINDNDDAVVTCTIIHGD